MNTPASTTAIDAGYSLARIAVELPGASAVLRQYQLDFCCNGQTLLGDACAEKNLDLPLILAQLNALQRPQSAPEATDAKALIAHIVERYHEVHRQQLPELIRMARRVEAVHQAKPDVPAGLADALEELEGELLNHMAKEEDMVFPLLLQGGDEGLVERPIAMLRREHNDHGEALAQLSRLTNDMTAPPAACNTWRALYTGLAQLRDDLIEHIHLENNVLFVLFDRTTRQELGCGSNCECS